MNKSKTSREKSIVRISIISIFANVALVTFKATVGLMSNSIAIISDAINNLSDALSSIITIIGAKLANRPADREHPYGHGRIEHVAAFIVSVIVLYAGITVLIESIKKVVEPETADYSSATIVILVAGIIVKCVLGIFVKSEGKRLKSDALIGSGTDALNDAVVSTSVLASAIIYIAWGISLEAYVGILVAAMIIKTGVDLVRASVDNMIGTRVESKLAKQIKDEIVKESEVQGAFDLILHDYGPEKYLGSVHIELPDSLTVAQVDQISRRITSTIMKKYGVILHTIGVYSVNTIDKEIAKIEQRVREIVFSHKEVLEMHGFYLDKSKKAINLDVIIDFAAKSREQVYREIYDEVQKEFKGFTITITLDDDLSD